MEPILLQAASGEPNPLIILAVVLVLGLLVYGTLFFIIWRRYR